MLWLKVQPMSHETQLTGIIVLYPQATDLKFDLPSQLPGISSADGWLDFGCAGLTAAYQPVSGKVRESQHPEDQPPEEEKSILYIPFADMQRFVLVPSTPAASLQGAELVIRGVPPVLLTEALREEAQQGGSNVGIQQLVALSLSFAQTLRTVMHLMHG